MKIAVGITHAPFAPKRLESLNSLLRQVPEATVFASGTPESSEIWAKRLWRWGAEQDADAVIYLNDDVELCENFLDVVAAMWHPGRDGEGEPLSLHTTNPQQTTRFARSYHMTGPAYVLSPEQTKSLLAFAEMHWEHNEDNVGSAWSRHVKKPFMSFIPCPVRHRVDVPSTLGYDNHPNRQTRHFVRELPIRSDLWEPGRYADVPEIASPL